MRTTPDPRERRERFAGVALALVVGGMLLLPCRLRGEESDTPPGLFALSLDELMDVRVEVASLQDETYLTAAGTVYVITEQEIARYGWRSLMEIIEAIPSMDLARTYAQHLGGQRGFHGINANIVLMVDGREVENPISDVAPIDLRIPAHFIKRVEFLMGPQSTLYGSRAMQGVINVVTKLRDEQQDDTTEVHAWGGEVGERAAAVVMRKNGAQGSVGFSAYHSESDQDWDEVRDFFLSNDGNYLNPVDSQRNRIRDYSHAGYVLNIETTAIDMHADYRGFYGGFTFHEIRQPYGQAFGPRDWKGNFTTEDYLLSYVGVTHAFCDTWEANLELRFLDYEFDTTTTKDRNGDVAASYAELDTFLLRERLPARGPDIEASISGEPLQAHHVSLGYEYSQRKLKRYGGENVDETARTERTGFDNNPLADRTEQSVYIQDSITLHDKLTTVAGLRYDHQDLQSDEVVPRASLIYMPQPHAAIKLTYGRGFRARNILEAGGAFLGGGSEPPDNLRPVKLEMVEANYSQGFEHGALRCVNILAVYHMEETDRFIRSNEIDPTTPNDLTVVGAEDFLKFYYGSDLSGFFGIRYVQPDKVTVAGERVIKDVPEIKLKLGLSYQLCRQAHISAFIDWWDEVITAATRPEGGLEARRIDDWAVVDVKLGLGPFSTDGVDFEIALSVENVFDETYFHANNAGVDVVQYLQPPRTARLGLTALF